MNSQATTFYRKFFSDLSIDQSEGGELTQFLNKLQPPPGKLVWLRSQAFRVGNEFLTDDKEKNKSLLRAINFVVHAIETTCMQPKEIDRVDVETDTLKEFYEKLYEDLKVNAEENRDILRFFQKQPPSDLITARATAFQVACDFLSDEKDTNVALLTCINAAVHSLEQALYEPKEYHLKPPQEDVSGLSLEQAVQKLWTLDANRLESGDDYVINVQGGKKPFWKEDTATDPLFQSVDKEVWQRPTYKAFHKLLDNYSSEIGVSESVSGDERREIIEFLDAICQTAPMQFCHLYCRAKDSDRIPEDMAAFKQLLYKIWFELYHRGDNDEKDSSGFEHVFLGEVRDGEVTGFHNWIQFYFEEKKGELDYRGYLKPKSKNDTESNGNDHVLTLQFHWKGVEKFAGTFFVGVSPEFEMALYTMCFLVGEEENNVDLDTGVDVFGLRIKCYRMARDKIGTAFPEVTSQSED